MNQICQTFGHDQRKIQYICLQPQEILWACSQCFEENKDRYDFQPIKNVLEILEQTIKEVRKNNSRKQIDEIKNLFTEVQNQIVEKFNQSMQFLKESFQLQYDELLGFLKFFNTFEIDQLDSDHQENLKYLQIVVHQKASQQTIFEVQTNFKIERLNNIKKKIIENMKELYDQEFELYLERLNIRYNLPNEFREQIKKLQIPEEYLMNDNLKIQYCFNLKKDNNICYNGQLYNDQLQGIGLLEVEDRKIIYYGAFIDGHFTNGIKCKIEENQLFLGSFQYISEYEYQIAHNGTLIQANRMRYDGNFENEIQNGQGICHYKNKDYYCGGWKNGLYEGKGQLNSEDYGQIEGEFKNGKLNGQAIFQNAKIKDNLMHGQGILEDFLNKTKYIGQFKDGQKDGEGIFKISDQQEIEGTFRNDQPSGKCKERICQVVVENLKKNLIETLEEGEYNNGIKTGVFSSITTSNDLIIQKTKYYENGQLIYEEEDDS